MKRSTVLSLPLQLVFPARADLSRATYVVPLHKTLYLILTYRK